MGVLELPNAKMTRILVVEDDDMSRDILVRRLQKQGYELYPFADAEAGLEAINSVKPDILLLDINLPGMSGLELAQELKTHPETACIPMIAVSADTNFEDMQTATTAGFDAYETKPINLPNLLLKIQQLVGSRTAA
jgi:two-component system cell cycle response regulator DivK